MSTDTHSERSPNVVEHHDSHDGKEHWSDWQYVQLAIALAVVTGVEVLLTYIRDDMGAFFLPALLLLMAVKFFAVVMYFMHLKFDNRLFSLMFYMGLFLAVAVYVAALMTFKFFDP
jgi:cytochrome c oxidase subunit 4